MIDTQDPSGEIDKVKADTGDANAIDAIKILDHHSQNAMPSSVQMEVLSYTLDTGAEQMFCLKVNKDIYIYI